MATMYIALEAAIGGGALFAGWYYNDIINHIPTIIYASAAVIAIALLYLVWRSFQLQKQSI